MKRIALFVDGSNFSVSLKSAGFRVDYQRIREYFAGFGDLIGSYYFTALPPKDEPSSIRSLTDSLQHKGWTLVTKEIKVYRDQPVAKTKGNMDVEMVVKAWTLATHITDLILFSGDGDFKAMVDKLQDGGVRVTAISFHSHDSRNMVSDALRKSVHEFINLPMLRGEFEMNGGATAPSRKSNFLNGE